jgi:hypothetical protein
VKFNLCGGAQDILSTSVLMQISLCFVIIWERTEKRNAGGKERLLFRMADCSDREARNEEHVSIL